jgi:hypothetical protein
MRDEMETNLKKRRKKLSAVAYQAKISFQLLCVGGETYRQMLTDPADYKARHGWDGNGFRLQNHLGNQGIDLRITLRPMLMETCVKEWEIPYQHRHCQLPTKNSDLCYWSTLKVIWYEFVTRSMLYCNESSAIQGSSVNDFFIYYGPTALCWALAAFSLSWSYIQSVGPLKRGISPSQGLYLHEEQHKQNKHT